jgi:hypothetical protein
MNRQYRLIRLRTETVQDLKRLMAQLGNASLDDLIISMIRLMDAYRLNLKNTGWHRDERG